MGDDEGALVREDELTTDLADSVIRCLPEDHTNGFFVCAFLRRDPSEMPQAQKSESTEQPKKRARENAEEEMEVEVGKTESPVRDTEPKSETIKTAAQAERLRRKKQLQKAKKRKVD